MLNNVVINIFQNILLHNIKYVVHFKNVIDVKFLKQCVNMKLKLAKCSKIQNLAVLNARLNFFHWVFIKTLVTKYRSIILWLF